MSCVNYCDLLGFLENVSHNLTLLVNCGLDSKLEAAQDDAIGVDWARAPALSDASIKPQPNGSLSSQQDPLVYAFELDSQRLAPFQQCYNYDYACNYALQSHCWSAYAVGQQCGEAPTFAGSAPQHYSPQCAYCCAGARAFGRQN